VTNDEKRDDQENEDEIEIEGVVTDINDAKNGDSKSDKETESLRQELEKAKNDFLYCRAEFDNYKKRALKERSEYIRYAGEQSFVLFLDVLDNFERALQAEVTPENVESFRKGVELIAENFRSVFKKFGVVEVPSEGVPFDPNQHEALGSEETEKIPPGHIAKTFRKTYKMHDKVIRPGQVIVAKAKTEQKE
jgi:molecular chaperone GrpE